MAVNKEVCETLKHFLTVAPFISLLTIEDVGLFVCDTEEVLWDFIPETFQWYEKTYVGVKPGPEWAVTKAMNQRKRIVEEVGKEAFGVPYVAVAMPILENDQVVGGIAVQQSIDKREKLMEIVSSLNQTIKTLDVTAQQIAAEAEELSAMGQELGNVSEDTNTQVGETDTVVEVISKIADQTNLIGLNAAIEAARVGESGRGFGVVADEVRKLAQSSSASTKNIRQILGKIKSAVEQINSGVKEVKTVSEHQAQVLVDMSAAVAELTKLSDSLLNMAKDLTADVHR